MIHLRTGRKPELSIVIPVLNQHRTTEECMKSWFSLAKSCLRFVFIDNGSDEPLSEQPFIEEWSRFHDIIVVRNEKNTGVYPTFQQGYELLSNSRFIFYSHNDVDMLVPGWDKCLIAILSGLDRPGVCGMFGAKGIGTPDIYKAPYRFEQMMRWGCVTVPSMIHSDGDEMVVRNATRVMVLDGFSLIINTDMIKNVMGGKFDHESFPVHHMYDQDICVTSHYGGYNNYVVDLDCKHRGGVTSTRENWAEEMGTSDLSIHREAHKVFYDKWRGKLPVSVE